MRLKLHVWRQKGPDAPGRLVAYDVPDASEHMSFLELLDVLNERLIERGEEPIAFDHDCREGICGSCGFMISGVAHGPAPQTTVCQLHLRKFRDGDELTLEPWRAKAFPVIKDLVVDRSAFDRIVQAGGYVSVNTGSAPDGNAIPVPKNDADLAMDAAQCIGCGACVAQCPNGAAQLFTAAKISHLGLLPQGQAERADRALRMVAQLEAEAFGSCTNFGECEAVCPKGISIDFIARMNRDWLGANARGKREPRASGGTG
jgi:succinate dehydrogenase / fumarate reductase iron-sulfur subunit